MSQPEELPAVPFTGGCVCGAVRYECSAQPILMMNCHCKTCQKVTGGAYAPVVLVALDALTWTKGLPKYHFTERVTGDSHKRGFCADCGSRLTGAEFEVPSGLIGLAASSLDDSTWYKPQYDIFTAHAQPWDVMDPALPKHRHYPPKPSK